MNDMALTSNQRSAIEVAMEHLKAEREGRCGCDFCNWVRMMRREGEDGKQGTEEGMQISDSCDG